MENELKDIATGVSLRKWICICQQIVLVCKRGEIYIAETLAVEEDS